MKKSVLSEMYFHAGQLALAIGKSGEKLDIPPEVLSFAASPERRKLRRQILRLLYDAYLVRVPDISAEELLRRFEADNADNAYADALRGWDFYRGRSPGEERPRIIDGPGRVYEWRFWTPARKVRGADAAAHAVRDGWFGHTGAFIQWRRVNRMSGFFTSVPADVNDCFMDPISRFAHVAYSRALQGDPCGRNVPLETHGWGFEMPPQTTFLEFREVKI